MTNPPTLPKADGPARLWVACGTAALLHMAVLFGVGISREPAMPVTLEVTLLALPGSQTPLAAKLLAPIASTGGGTHRELDAPATAGGSSRERAGLQHAASHAMQATESPDSSLRILSTETAADMTHDARNATSRPGQDPALQLQRREQAGHSASSTEPRPSHPLVSDIHPGNEAGLNTRASRQAAYRALWRQKVERAGSANFPWSALTAGQPKSLTLMVRVRADGTVAHTKVTRSSGLPSLDRAALDILRMAAPFPPFPDDLRRDSTALSFVYDWEFLPGERATLRIGR